MVAKKPTKEPLVTYLVRKGLSVDQESAEKEILAGLIRVDDSIVDKVGAVIRLTSKIEKIGVKRFVSRAALKLEAAVDSFPIPVVRAVCADVGACTGGFTEVLLQNGAAKVFAIDVGYGNLDWKIRSDSRVVVMERTNARYIESLPEPVKVVVIDVSFISLRTILPRVVTWMEPDGHIVALIKPQFEASREEVSSGGGIISDPTIHDRVNQEISHFLPSVGLSKQGLISSPILGAEGNKEFVLWATLNSVDA
jgi:23S rRNA (cytidine1920-2'-O)/16S rRNA (cytidine1409-2'-O)-methyltransferase